MITEASIHEELAKVSYPGFSRDIVSFGLVKEISIDDDGNVTVKLSVATREPAIPRQIHEEALEVLEAIEGIGKVTLDFDIKDPPQPVTGGIPPRAKAVFPG